MALWHSRPYSAAMTTDAKHRLTDVRAEMAKAAKTAARDTADIALIAISKTQDADAIRPLIEAGQRLFGENRVQEAVGKWPAFKAQYSDVILHLIGPLQTNKARQAMELCDAIHSVDRPKLAGTLARLAQEMGTCPDLFIQINIGQELQKAGVLPADADEFIAAAREVPEVLEIQTFLGRVDVRLSVIARDIAHYQHIWRERLLTLPHIADIEALMHVARIKSKEGLPV